MATKADANPIEMSDSCTSSLEAIDIALLSTASNFDLTIKDERQRSVRELERLFFGLVAGSATSLFVEAGAKEAAASRRAAKRLIDTPVVAFEANRFTFERFSKKVDYQACGVDYRNVALSDGPSTVTMKRAQDRRRQAVGRWTGVALASRRLRTWPHGGRGRSLNPRRDSRRV